VRAVRLRTADGEHLAALHLPGRSKELAIVVAHGFTWSSSRPGARRVHHAMHEYAGVLAFDFRGHGASTGRSTVGDREVLDVDAAVEFARNEGYARVATLGFSMGGCVVLRQAALLQGVDAVVSVSAPSRWYYKGTWPMRRVHWVIERRLGRVVARRLLGTRISDARWNPVPDAPVEVVARIPPTPLLIVHGDHDPYLPVDHARALAEAAGEQAELWIVPGFGHAEGAIDSALLERVGDWVLSSLRPAA
jgi:pimeloyl-ACP methyl ester carboxylesterase